MIVDKNGNISYFYKNENKYNYLTKYNFISNNTSETETNTLNQNKRNDKKIFKQNQQIQIVKEINQTIQPQPYISQKNISRGYIQNFPFGSNYFVNYFPQIIPLDVFAGYLHKPITRSEFLKSQKNDENNTRVNSNKAAKLSLSESSKDQLINADKSFLSTKNINFNHFISNRVSEKILFSYGDSHHKYNKCLEEIYFKIPPDFLSKHEITPSKRTKMVDWMVEVLSIYEAHDETFFLAVTLMDLFLWKADKTYKDENVYLIGIISMFIATKFEERYPITLRQLMGNIGKNHFNKREIKLAEINLFNIIHQYNLVSTSIYEFVSNYFCDFFWNNKKLFCEKEDLQIFKNIKITACYLSKLIVHYEYFYNENNQNKALGCIIASINLVNDYLKDKFNGKIKDFFLNWVITILNLEGIEKDFMISFSDKILNTYREYQNSDYINKNLNRFFPLPYLKD